MILIDHLRARADGAATQTRTTLTTAQEKLADVAGDATGRATSVVAVAGRQAYAFLGAADTARDAVTRRAQNLPADAQRRATKVAVASRSGVTAVAGLRRRGESVVSTTRSMDIAGTVDEARAAVTERVGRLRSTFDVLADRGEQVTKEMRRDERVLRVIGGADKLAEVAANEVTSVAQKVRVRAAANGRRVTARKAAATRAARGTADVASMDAVASLDAVAVRMPAGTGSRRRSPAPATASPAEAARAKSGPATSSAAKSSPAKSGAAKAVRAKSGPAKSSPAKSGPVKSGPVKSSQAESSPPRSGSAKSATNPSTTRTARRSSGPRTAAGTIT